jgi:hypothetical protein
MNYAQVKDNVIVAFPLSEDEIKAMFPNTSFTNPFEPPDGFVEVESAPAPIAKWNEIAIEDSAAYTNGKWISKWKIEQVAPEVAVRLEEDKSYEKRSQRNALLAQSDWTQLSDAPVDATAWTSYRQALRDITLQDGFPHDITWPEKP